MPSERPTLLGESLSNLGTALSRHSSSEGDSSEVGNVSASDALENIDPVNSEQQRLVQSAASGRDINSASVREAEAMRVKVPWESVFLDSLFLLLSLAWLGLAVCGYYLDRMLVTESNKRLQHALRLSPSLFAPMYAAIHGRLNRAYAHYKSQTGETLICLEQFIRSQSIFTALESLFRLRNFTIFSIIATVAWGQSILGGQSFLRLLTIVPKASLSTENIFYLGPEFLGHSPLTSSPPLVGHLSAISILYLSTLLSPPSVRDSPRDLWNNPKSVLQKSFFNPSGAIHVLTNLTQRDGRKYGNLIGIPITHLTNGVHASFLVESISFEFSCPDDALRTTLAEFARSIQEPLFGVANESGVPSLSFQQSVLQTSGISTSFLTMTESSWHDFRANTSQPIDMYYGSRTRPLSGDLSVEEGTVHISAVKCGVSAIRLRSSLSCRGLDCEFDKVHKLPANLTDDQVDTLGSLITSGAWPGMGMATSEDQSSLTESYIANPSAVIKDEDENNSSYVELWAMPHEILEERLSLTFNAFYYAACLQIFSSGSGSTTTLKPSIPWVSTNATLTKIIGEQYICDRVWLTWAILVMVIVTCMAATTLVLHCKTQVPDVLGLLSTLVMDNEYCTDAVRRVLPSSVADGLDRTRVLGNIRFALTDVDILDAFGHMAFKPLRNGEDARLAPKRRRFI